MKLGVFGLPRSGTNFMEWTLRTNFIDLEVEERDFILNDVPPHIPKVIHKKHTFPTLDGLDGCVVIYKGFVDWIESLERFKKTMWFPYTLKSWEDYLEKARELPKDKCLIIEHSWMVKNYSISLSNISSHFGVKLKEDWETPLFRFNDFVITNELYNGNIFRR
jgi:hypothetical protein